MMNFPEAIGGVSSEAVKRRGLVARLLAVVAAICGLTGSGVAAEADVKTTAVSVKVESGEAAKAVEQRYKVSVVDVMILKRQTLARMLRASRYEPDWPATIIHECANREIVCDEEAASGPG